MEFGQLAHQDQLKRRKGPGLELIGTAFPFAKPARMASARLDSTAAGKIRGTIRYGTSNICEREEREREMLKWLSC
ncbi:uncharacterized protein MONOS_18359 [Monocercomonoides exilis]|uniref:uncharacterized protein n=1 Tax=Monocercomonoides exilis TaxID=2049356 RepID=UPI00355A98E1|nr:hypothetical protein MONOS_18359 [Monocercomonoides exilis]